MLSKYGVNVRVMNFNFIHTSHRRYQDGGDGALGTVLESEERGDCSEERGDCGVYAGEWPGQRPSDVGYIMKVLKKKKRVEP